ncbi:hypothetical protein PENTCL1PPCAC_3443, partial [Pristionchus entomophagus]
FFESSMDRFVIPGMPPGCLPLMDSLRSSLSLPGWPAQLRPTAGLQPAALQPPTTTTATSSAVILPLNPLSIAAITGVLRVIEFSVEISTYSHNFISKNIKTCVQGDVETASGDDEDDEDMDKDSDRTDPATTPSTVSLSSPTRLTFPQSPGESDEGRRQSIGNLSAKSLAALNKKRVTCDMCGKSYCDKGALKIHTSAVHLKEMQLCTVPGCTKEFTSRRSRNRHSKNKNMKLHTSDPAKLAALTAIQEQSRLLSGAMLGQTLPVRESRKRKSTEGALDLTMHTDSLVKPTPLLPSLPAPNMQLMLLQQMQQMMHSQLFVQHQAAALAAAAAAVTAASTAPSTTVSQASPSAP